MQNTPKIVVIDPDPDIRMTLDYTLATAGFQVFAVKNGDEGLHKCFAERPVAVLTEISIGGLDGYELCGKIKGEPVTRQVTHVILMTSHSENEVFVRGPEACADYFVPKPFNPKTLINDLRMLIEYGFKISPESESLLGIARRIPTHREAITPGYAKSKKVVHLNPPAVKFGETNEYGKVRKPTSKSSTSAPARPRDPHMEEINQLLKSLSGSFYNTREKLQAVVTFLDKKA